MTILGTARAQVFNLVLLSVLVISGCSGGGGGSNIGRVAGVDAGVIITPKTGAIVAATVNSTITLKGGDSASTSTSGEPLTYAWKFTNIPDASKASLTTSPDNPNATFKADVVGMYRAELVVSVDGVHSRRAIALVQIVADTGTTPTKKELWGNHSHSTLSNDCVSCHNDTYLDPVTHKPYIDPDTGLPIVAKSGDHPATSNTCAACHDTYGFKSATNVYGLLAYNDHKEVLGICSQCHNGTTAIGKSPYHQQTEEECSNCHDTDSFLKLDPVTHKYDHTDINSNCVECHDGIVAPGKPQGHPATQKDCYICHTATPGTTFAGAAFDHTGITSGCAAGGCHDGASSITLLDGSQRKIRGMSDAPAHPVIDNAYTPDPTDTLECNACHYTGNNFSFDIGQGFRAYDHKRVDALQVQCQLCHNNQMRQAYPTYAQVNMGAFIQSKESAMGMSGKAHIDVGSNDCGMCHFVYPDSFGHIDPTFDHTQIANFDTTRCDGGSAGGCHSGTDPNIKSLNDAAAHMPIPIENLVTNTPYDCRLCHSPGTFTSGFYTHFDVNAATDCELCHNDVISIGKPVNHVPTNGQTCGFCHYDPAANAVPPFSTFAGAKFDHSGLTTDSTCAGAGCHDGLTATGTNAAVDHMPVPDGMSCAKCHLDAAQNSNFTTFGTNTNTTTMVTKSPTVDHAALDLLASPAGSYCTSCHNDHYAPGKPLVHIPTKDTCDKCHVYTPATKPFKSPETVAKFNSAVHNSITTGCNGCHDGSLKVAANALSMDDAMPKPPGHIPTDKTCNACHNSKTTFNSFTATLVVDIHKNVAKNCQNCHNDTFKGTLSNGSVVRSKSSTLDLKPPITHPATTTNDCVECHYTPTPSNPTTTFADKIVAHQNLDFTAQSCSSAGCHDGLSPPAKGTNDYPPPGTHPNQLGRDCGACHSPGGSFQNAVFDHLDLTTGQPISSGCADCHNGTDATGLDPTTHISIVIPGSSPPTNWDCSECHNTSQFKGATFDHLDSNGKKIVDGCADCHNGNGAPGKKTNHIPTGDDCHVCHTTAGFYPSTWHHTGIDGVRCDSCHDGIIATGKPTPQQDPNHPLTTDDCGGCHTPETVDGWFTTFDHTGITSGCSDCHNGVRAKGMLPSTKYPGNWNHIPTTEDCSSCHTPGDFKISAKMNHVGMTKSTDCTQCHYDGNPYNVEFYNKTTHFITSLNCAECHAVPAAGKTGNWNGSWTHKSWTTANFPNNAMKYPYPGNHRATVISTCKQCHTKQTEIAGRFNALELLLPDGFNVNSSLTVTYNGKSATSLLNTNTLVTKGTPYCAACHKGSYKGADGHTSLAVDDNCGRCHSVTGTAFRGG